jgi:hypothetical protein
MTTARRDAIMSDAGEPMSEKSIGTQGPTPLSTLGAVLREIGWEPTVAENISAFEVDFGHPHLPVASALAAIVDEGRLVIFINFGFQVNEGQRTAASAFIAEANWSSFVGELQLDMADGQLRAKVGVDFTGSILNETLIRNAIRSAMQLVDAHAKTLASFA